jgi:hypothetical protein
MFERKKQKEKLPRRSFPSLAAGPSGKISLICKKCSPFSFPPMMVKPKPVELFCNEHEINSPDKCGDDEFVFSLMIDRETNKKKCVTFCLLSMKNFLSL